MSPTKEGNKKSANKDKTCGESKEEKRDEIKVKTPPSRTKTPTKKGPLEAHLINQVPNLPAGYKFADKFEIIERIGFDDRVGATYFVVPLNVESSYAAELVLRVEKFRPQKSVLPIETNIITEAEKAVKHIFFSQLHASGKIGAFIWYTTFFRGGPTLQQITDFMRTNRATGACFSSSTVGRLAENLFEIVGFLHKIGFLICSLDQTMFQFCGASRTLFLSDLSSCRCEPRGPSMVPQWTGALHYMPTRWNEFDTIKRNAELEAVFYMVMELALGELPWSHLGYEDCLMAMLDFAESNSIPLALQTLDNAYYKLWLLVKVCSTASQPYPSVECILTHCKFIYEQLGGCMSLDDDFDFERQPREDELPRFVLEKDEDAGVDAAAIDDAEDAAATVEDETRDINNNNFDNEAV